MILASQIAAATGCTLNVATDWHAPLIAAMTDFEINTPARMAAFLPQLGHETRGLSELEENLNYSAEGLLRVFPRHFSPLEAAAYAHKPAAIANRAYALRNGNGPESSGDGWLYRARGPIGITGLINYAAARDSLRRLFGAMIVPDFVAEPDQLLNPRWGAATAAEFWKRHGCNELADAGDYDAISDVINIGHKTVKQGDANGYADRLARFEVAKNVLGVLCSPNCENLSKTA